MANRFTITEEDRNRIKRLYGVKGLASQQTPLKIQTNGPNVNINGQDYRLQVYKLGGWKNVSINKVNPRPDGGYDITASLGIFSQSDVVTSDTVKFIQSNVGNPEIMLGGKTPKKLVKI